MENQKHTLLDKASTHRLPNILVLKALDHALRGGVNRCLQQFVLDAPLKALTRGERRYRVWNAALPAQYHREGSLGRACIQSEDGSTRFELQKSTLRQDALFIFSDQGSVGWVGYAYLFLQMRVFGFYHWDICHHIHNQVENSIKKAHQWFLITELIVCLNLCMGPWSGAAWFQTMAQGMADYVSCSTWCDPLFQHFYEWIAEDLEDTAPSTFRSAEHLQKIWALLPKARVFTRKGIRVKKARWMSIWDSLEEFLPWWSCYALVSTWVCIRYGLIRGLQDLPFNEGDDLLPAAPQARDDEKPEDEARPQSKEVRHSNDEVAKMRSRARNTLHLACLILCCRLKRHLVAALLE
jgi:hypothetical protein